MVNLKTLAWCSLIFFACACERPVRAEPDDGFEDRILGGLRPAVYWNDEEPVYDLAARMQHWKVPAVSIAVVDGMQIRWAGAFGAKETGGDGRVDTATVFQAASVSKPVAAVGALVLNRDGRLPLDNDVNELFDDWHLPHRNDDNPVTVRRILSHSAALGVGGFEGYAPEDTLPSLQQIIDGVPPSNSPAVRVVGEPGTGFTYSGGGYQVLQKIMQDVTGRSFTAFMHANVFDPLGMNDSTYAPLDDARKRNAAHGHLPDGPIRGHGPIHAESAAGGLWTTPSDLARLLIDLMKAQRGEPAILLDQRTAREMLEPVFWDFGLGFKVMGKGRDFRFSHGGATRGWHCHFMAFPARGQAVVVMTNGTNGWVLWPEVERAVAHELGWPNLRPARVRSEPMRWEALRQYGGSYRMPGLVVRVTLGSGGLEFSGAGLTWRLVPSTPDRFAIIDMEGEVKFKRGEDGAVEGMHLWFGEPDWSPYREWDFKKLD